MPTTARQTHGHLHGGPYTAPEALQRPRPYLHALEASSRSRPSPLPLLAFSNEAGILRLPSSRAGDDHLSPAGQDDLDDGVAPADELSGQLEMRLCATSASTGMFHFNSVISGH